MIYERNNRVDVGMALRTVLKFFGAPWREYTVSSHFSEITTTTRVGGFHHASFQVVVVDDEHCPIATIDDISKADRYTLDICRNT